jgi:hypothetical protein
MPHSHGCQNDFLAYLNIRSCFYITVIQKAKLPQIKNLYLTLMTYLPYFV